MIQSLQAKCGHGCQFLYGASLFYMKWKISLKGLFLFFFFFFAGEYIFKNKHTVGCETLREPIDFNVVGSRVQEEPVTVYAVGSTVFCSDPCRLC